MANEVIQFWKIPHMVKGALTWVPALTNWRLRHGATGGTDSARYCYSVWLRHLTLLNDYGFKAVGAHIGELGPGDSIGVGLATLLSGAESYTGLDLVPFSQPAELAQVYEQLVAMFAHQSPIPGDEEFPRVRPKLNSYAFPNDLVDLIGFGDRVHKIRRELKRGLDNKDGFINYKAPWNSDGNAALGSLDLIFSQAVLEHVDNLDETYAAMYLWLKPGGYASHVIDFSAHYLSPFWNGHWSYSDREWRIVRGRRHFLLNRQPLSRHIASAEGAGFKSLRLHYDYGIGGLQATALSKRFQKLDQNDLQTRGAVVILRKE